ncbi:hypothetical protein SLEP1_g39193 [Rubroshorea leprosula]|uniref:Uncharacterized protein n=1 Tax=Rubroshorea leprosula TaxID=152421 RepID=A0AAV5L021_9ROSI|nr:hypothetical protein SLEP1_g39193 [Rubroshorea leprosula]
MGPPRNQNPRRNYIHNPSINLHYTNPTTNFKRRSGPSNRIHTTNNKTAPAGSVPSLQAYPGSKWPVKPPVDVPATPSWPQFKPKQDQPSRPLSDEEQAKLTSMIIQQKLPALDVPALDACRGFFKNRVDRDRDDDGESEDFECEDEDYLLEKDEVDGSEEYKFFWIYWQDVQGLFRTHAAFNGNIKNKKKSSSQSFWTASSKAKLNALPKVLETPCHANGRAIAGNGRFSTGPDGAFINRNLESVPSPGTGN